MKSVSFLQIGDIHYPENSDGLLADIKDANLPAITNQAVPNPLQVVFRALSRSIEDNNHSAIMICGDLTSRGDISQYELCVQYLIKSLDLRSKSKESIHVVPGNHDVNRSLCTDRNSINTKKFEPLLKAWSSFSSNVLSTSGIRSETIRKNDCNLQIFSMNSCMGCGEWHLLPRELRNELGDLIEKARSEDSSKAFELEGEQIDTPMFKHDDIDELNQQLHGVPVDCLPVILAHHNLLPQEFARIELYTELINSGPFRSSVASNGRPIIYCHGHIHAGPIEVISDVTEAGSQLICVSAPEIKNGYNELVGHFSNDGKPLGLEVITHRVRRAGVISEESRHKIPFCNRGDFLTDEMDQIIACVKKEPMKFHKLKKLFDTETGTNVQTETFAGLLQEAAWFGIVTIENQQPDRKYWQIKRRLV